MSGEFNYAGWRRSWPDVVAGTKTQLAVDYLQRYYALFEDNQPHYTGSRFEAMPL
jgi:hypothetical protein